MAMSDQQIRRKVQRTPAGELVYAGLNWRSWFQKAVECEAMRDWQGAMQARLIGRVLIAEE